MTAPRDSKAGMHPLARPLSGLSSPRAGLIALIVIAVLVVGRLWVPFVALNRSRGVASRSHSCWLY